MANTIRMATAPSKPDLRQADELGVELLETTPPVAKSQLRQSAHARDCAGYGAMAPRQSDQPDDGEHCCHTLNR